MSELCIESAISCDEVLEMEGCVSIPGLGIVILGISSAKGDTSRRVWRKWRKFAYGYCSQRSDCGSGSVGFVGIVRTAEDCAAV